MIWCHKLSYIIYIRSDKGLMLETSAFLIFHGDNSTFINLFDKTKFFIYITLTLYTGMQSRFWRQIRNRPTPLLTREEKMLGFFRKFWSL